MNVVLVMNEILAIANSVIGEPALPDFSFSTQDGSQGVRIAALDELNRVFERYVVGGSEQEMDVLGHDDEGVQLESTFAAISAESLQEEADMVLDNKKSTAFPSRECDEIGSGRGDESVQASRANLSG